jgi:hypothetical protein
MSCQTTDKKNKNNGLNLSSLSSIISIINTAFNLYKKPTPPLPPQLVLFGANLRPGLSARDIAARIISRRSEAGLPSGDSSNGPNRREQEITIIAEEIVYAMQNEAKIQAVGTAGQGVTGMGIGFGGVPVPVQGSTTTPALVSGVIS